MQLKEKYITDEQGNRVGVLLDIEQYQQLLEQLEELEAIQAYDNAILLDDEEIPFEDIGGWRCPAPPKHRLQSKKRSLAASAHASQSFKHAHTRLSILHHVCHRCIIV